MPCHPFPEHLRTVRTVRTVYMVIHRYCNDFSFACQCFPDIKPHDKRMKVHLKQSRSRINFQIYSCNMRSRCFSGLLAIEKRFFLKLKGLLPVFQEYDYRLHEKSHPNAGDNFLPSSVLEWSAAFCSPGFSDCLCRC